jgi:hypothetical protein
MASKGLRTGSIPHYPGRFWHSEAATRREKGRSPVRIGRMPVGVGTMPLAGRVVPIADQVAANRKEAVSDGQAVKRRGRWLQHGRTRGQPPGRRIQLIHSR